MDDDPRVRNLLGKAFSDEGYAFAFAHRRVERADPLLDGVVYAPRPFDLGEFLDLVLVLLERPRPTRSN